MDILFESSFVKDYKWAKEVFFKIRRKFLVISLAFILAYQALLIYDVANNPGKMSVNLIIDAFFLLFYCYIIAKSIKAPVKADLATHGKNLSIRVCATEEKLISYKSSGDVAELDYARVKRIKQSKNYLYLISDAGIWYCVSKNGFTVGDYGSFISFLFKKGLEM